MNELRVALVGAGSFGRNHARVVSELPGVTLAAIVDSNDERAGEMATRYGCPVFATADRLSELADCAIVATPTVTHEPVASHLLRTGLDVLVEKPIAHSAEAGERLRTVAEANGRILQVGHLERFNPAITALEREITIPLFFETHRMSVFTPRSLDVDVVLDLMIHDLDIVLTTTCEYPNEIRAAGISVLTPLVDIANVRLQFPSGCVANLTASRVSTEKVRKLRLFQPGEYISVDYARREALKLAVSPGNIAPPALLPVTPGEPLTLELEAFFAAVKTRSEPRVTAKSAANALRLAESILSKIQEHGAVVRETLAQRKHSR